MIKICLNCDNEFEAKVDRAKFCSNLCRATFSQNIKINGGKIIVRIYQLINPINNSIFYVGKTIGSLRTRLTAHLGDNINIGKTSIIKEIVSAGLKPKIEEIEKIECSSETEETAALERELFWITTLRERGCVLCNVITVTNPENLRLAHEYSKQIEQPKGKNTSIRFDETQVSIAFGKSGKATKQKLVDFLIERYVNGEQEHRVVYAPITPASYDSPKVSHAHTDEAGQWQEPKTPLTKLQRFLENISNADSRSKIESYLVEAKRSAMQWKDMIIVQNHAKQIMEQKGFIYND